MNNMLIKLICIILVLGLCACSNRKKEFPETILDTTMEETTETIVIETESNETGEGVFVEETIAEEENMAIANIDTFVTTLPTMNPSETEPSIDNIYSSGTVLPDDEF